MTLAPPALIPDNVVWPRLVALRDCLAQSLAARGGVEPCVVSVVPGAVVDLEYCSPCGDKCGMGWVRLESVFPSSSFPVPDTQALGCNTLLAFTVELGVVRCAPVGDPQGNPPSQEEWEAAVELQLSDMMAMRATVKCCFGNQKTMFGTYQPIGPQGGCVGGSWSVAVSAEGTSYGAYQAGV